MGYLIKAVVEVFTQNPLTVTLAVFGVLFVGIAIIGRVPPIDLTWRRAVGLGTFGALLIVVSIGLAYLLAMSSITQFTGQPTTIVQQPAQPSLVSVAQSPAVVATPILPATMIRIGLWEYGKPRPPMPPPAGSNQVIFANGDINTSGTCHVKAFGTGEPVGGLGEGTFELWLISGSPEQVAAAEEQIQKGAEAHAGGACPYLR